MLKKILLAAAVIGPVIAISDVGKASQWGVGLPLGVVCLALYIIVTLLEKETARYDLEQRGHLTETKPSASSQPQAGARKIPAHA